MVQKISRALFGSFSGGRSTMAENSARWLGIMGSGMGRTSAIGNGRTQVAQQAPVQKINGRPDAIKRPANTLRNSRSSSRP